MHNANNKTVRVLTVAYDAAGVVVGCGMSRPLTLESARKRAAVPFTGFPASELVRRQERPACTGCAATTPST